MPELPEVQTVVNTLAPRLIGATVRSVTLHRNDVLVPPGFDLASHLVKRTITSISRRGKRIVFAMEYLDQFYIHLGMTGRLTIETREAPVQKHTHLIVEFVSRDSATPLQLRFRDPRRFGGIWWLGQDDPAGTMGPEPLTVTVDDLASRLRSTRRFIKTALLDQRMLAGLGNIYADEVLHKAGIHPKLRTDRLKREQVRQLTLAIKAVLRRALRHRGSTLRDYVDADGTPGGFQKLHRVYDRAGQPCLNCGSVIRRIVLGGRSTHFCPKCQARNKRF